MIKCDYCGEEANTPVTSDLMPTLVFCTRTCCNKKWSEFKNDK